MATVQRGAAPVNGRRQRPATAWSATAPHPKATPADLPVPRLACQTFGTPQVVAVADYPPATACDPDRITAHEHGVAFMTVLAAVFKVTEDLRDISFYLLLPTPDGAAWHSTRGIDWTLSEMVALSLKRTGVAS